MSHTSVSSARTRSAVILSAAKDLLLLCSLMLVVAAPAIAQPSRDVEKTLFRLEDDFAQAVVKRDARALGKLVAPKWVYSDESGVMEREAGIKAFTSGTDTVTKASNANMRAVPLASGSV